MALTGNRIVGVNPENGQIDWTFDDLGKEGSQYIVPTNTPLYKDGRIFTANGYGAGAFMLQLNEDASGVRLLWRNKALILIMAALSWWTGLFTVPATDGMAWGNGWLSIGIPDGQGLR